MGCCAKNEIDEMEMSEEDDRGGTPRKYGKRRKHDPNFKGPIENRSCTDVICCILFTLVILCMIAVGAISFLFGNPKKLLYPTDTEGNFCGAGEFADRKNLFFFDLTKCVPRNIHSLLKVTSCPTQQICVSKCPTKNSVGYDASKREDLFCKYNTFDNQTWSSARNRKLVDSGACAKYTLQSKAIAYRCVPTVIGDSLTKWLRGKNLTITTDQVKNGTIVQALLINLQNIGGRLIEDIRDSKYYILAGLCISVVASFLYIFIMRWFADILVWLTTYAVLTLNGYGIYYSYTEYQRLAKNDNTDIHFDFITNLSSYKDQKETWLVATIALSVIMAILLLLLLALRKRINIAIQLIKEGSRAVSAMTSTLLFPLFPWLLQLIALGWFLIVMAFLTTSSSADARQVLPNGTVTDKACSIIHDITKKFTKDNITCNFLKYNTHDNVLRLQIFHLFGWFWVMNFITALGQCVLAGAFASWYWAGIGEHRSRNMPSLPLLSSLGRTLRYHTGSLAFGSLIIAIIQIIRAALEYLEYKLTGHGPDPGPVAKFLLKCLKCCFWCLEKFMKFLNKNAYIEIAVYGKNFCTSAKNAFFLLMRNILRVAVLDKVTDFLLFIGKLSITIGVGYGSYQFFKVESSTKLNYYLTPVIVIMVGAWFIATAFFGVYGMAIDTIFICFLEDSERHDGSIEKPFYMSKKLKKLLGKKNKKEESDDNYELSRN